MYEEETANLEPMMYEEESPGFGPVGATRWQFIWLCSLILSFCYELPLAQLTTMHRLNPRFFDIVFIVGMLTVFPNLHRIGRMPKLFRIWAGIVATFAMCTVVWTPFLPFYYSKYSIFYALKYLQGLLAVYMALRIPISARQKKILHYMVVIGGIVVACYAIPQYLRGGAGPIYIPRMGKELVFRAGTLNSSLGLGYFHVAMFSSLASVMTLAFYHSLKSTISKLFCLGLGLFVSWPAFACGARAGVAACLVGWISLFFLAKASFKTIIIVLVIGALGFFSLYAPKVLSLEYLREKSLTFERFEEGERRGAGYAIMSRVTVNWYRLDLYRWQGWRIPFVGAGFYVAPHTYPDSTRKYRIGYGIHNSYLFVLEQGGFVAFVLFIAFLIACRNNLKCTRSSGNEADRAFATGMYAFFYALLVVMLGGQIFWYGFGKENFNTCMIVLFFLAVKPSTDSWSYEDIEYEPDDYLTENEN